ncbi:glycosyltransferase [Xanthomarina sp. GH4-25]|uniref:glycosyltransferase n=1 Tax=Xanthomarina sp. GH4-25 TaxID=3349335 RepID=UPI0038783298
MSKKIRILFTIPNFNTAGSGRVLYDLAKGLDKNVFDVLIVCKHDRGFFFKEIKALNLPVYLMDTTFQLRPYYKLFSRIKPFKKFLKEQSIDIVHSWHWSSDWTEVLATRWAGSKFVYTKKAMSWGHIHWKLRSFLSHFIITVNTDMDEFFPYKIQKKLIPFGLDTSHYHPDLFPKTENALFFKIITVANLVPVKGIETLIEAIKKTNKTDIYLEVIGDKQTKYAAYLEQLVMNLGLENQITFLGKQSDVRPFLAQADLYIISSKKEGMPMALVEAMSMQTPVLGSDISGINYVLKDFNSLLFESENIEQLSQKILEMYSKSSIERNVIGKELRHYCIKQFSLHAFIKSHENLYLKLAE